MLFPFVSSLGSLFLLFSFILNLFLVIGQVSKRRFLTDLYFAVARNRSQNLSYSFGLWNYCTGDINRNIQSCSKPVGAFNWAQTPYINNVVPGMANSKTVHGIFYAFFILIFIAMGLSFIFWLMSLPTCCTKHKRACGYSMATLCFITFLITLTSLILGLILILAGIRQLTRGNIDWQANAGNSLWVLIGSCASMFIAFLCYSGGACCAKKPREEYHDDASYSTTGVKKTTFFGRNKKVTKVEPIGKEPDYTTRTNNYDNLLPVSAQPVHNRAAFAAPPPPAPPAPPVPASYTNDAPRTTTYTSTKTHGTNAYTDVPHTTYATETVHHNTYGTTPTRNASKILSPEPDVNNTDFVAQIPSNDTYDAGANPDNNYSTKPIANTSYVGTTSQDKTNYDVESAYNTPYDDNTVNQVHSSSPYLHRINLKNDNNLAKPFDSSY